MHLAACMLWPPMMTCTYCLFPCRAGVIGGAVAVLGAQQKISWSLSNASLLRNSAGGSGGALAFTVPLQGVVCQHCKLQGNTAGLLGGALFSTTKDLCVASRGQVSMPGAVLCMLQKMAAGWQPKAQAWQLRGLSIPCLLNCVTCSASVSCQYVETCCAQHRPLV